MYRNQPFLDHQIITNWLASHQAQAQARLGIDQVW